MATVLTAGNITGAIAGLEYTVPITISHPSGEEISAMDLQINFDPLQIQFLSATAGTLTQGWSIVPNLVSGSISLQSPTSIQSGSGVVLNLKFRVLAAASGSIQIDIDEQASLLMEGGVSFSAVDGSITLAPPSVSSVSLFSNDGITNGYLNEGDVVIARVVMSSAVVVNGSPVLGLNIGGTIVSASYLDSNSTPATGELFFSYTIGSNLTDANGISIPANSLSLAAGVTIEDSAGQAAILSHAAVGDAVGYKVDTTVARPSINSAGGADNIITNSVGDQLIQGTAEPNALVSLYPVDSFGYGAAFATVTASASGAWSYVLTDENIAMLGQGISRTIACKATDSAGNDSVYSLDFNFSIFTQIPEPPIIDAIGGDDSHVTADAGDNTVIGTGLSGGIVKLYAQTATGSDLLLGSTTATAEGSWSYSLTNANLISIGRGTGRVITATVADPFGSTSSASDPFSFESTAIEAPPNNPPTLTVTSSSSPAFSSNSGLVEGAFVASFVTSDPDNNSVSVSLSDTTHYSLGTGSNSGKVLLTPAGLALVNSGDDLPSFTLTPNDGSTDGTAVSVDPSVSSEPRISSIQLVSATDAQNGLLNIGDTVTVQVKLTKAVIVQGTPRLKLMIGNSIVEARYNTSQSTPSSGDLLFAYDIKAGEIDDNGISIPADALLLPSGASIKDTDGKSAILSNLAVTDQQDFRVDTGIAAPVLNPIGGSDLIIADTNSDRQISGTAEANAVVMLAFNDNVFATTTASVAGSWSYSITEGDIDLLGQGPNKSVTVTAEDAAGNFASTPSALFSIHTQPPLPPTIYTIGGDDGIVSSSAADHLVQGRAQVGSTLLLYAGTPTTPGKAIGTVTVNQQGDWSYGLTPIDLIDLGEGSGRSLFAIARDPLGQTSQPSLPSDFAIDTKGPTIQSIALFSSEGALNGKLNAGDRVMAKISFSDAVIATIDPAPVLKLRIGSTVVDAVYVSSDAGSQNELLFDYVIKTGQTDLDGISIDANSLILPGHAGIEDSLGNPADLSHTAVINNSLFQVDTTVSAPIITNIGGSDRTISTVQNDNLIQGTAEAAATVSILVNGIVISAVTASDTGQWNYALTEESIEIIGQGSDKKLTAIAEDLAGNRSGPSTEVQFTVKSLRPAPPMIDSAGGIDRTISTRTADNIITGTAPAGSSVSIEAGTTIPETTLGITTASAQGSWSYVITSANLITLGQGFGKTITATAIDSVGNRSAASQPFTLTIDTVNPTMTSINLLNILINGEGVQNGFLNEGDIVAVDAQMSEPVLVTGLPTMGLQIGSTLVNAEYDPSESAPDTGRLRFKYTILDQQTDTDGISLPANPIVLPSAVTITDIHGNPADLTFAATGAQADFKVDTSVLAPVITAIGGSGTIVTTQHRLVTGTAEPFAGVFLIDDLGNFLVVNSSDQPLPIATANSSGQWSYALTDHDLQVIGQGSGRVLKAIVRDAAGNQSIESVSFGFSVYSEKPQAPNIDQAGSDNSNIITSISGDDLITGTAVAGCNVTLFKGDTILGTASVDQSGRWSYAITTANLVTLGQGTNKTITAITTDPISQQSEQSDPFAFDIDTLGPTVSSIVLESDDASFGYLTIGDIVTAKVTMSGESKVTGTPALKLQIGSAVVNAAYDPTASDESTGDLRFTYTVLASQTDDAGISIPSNALTLPANAAITDELGNAANLSNPAISSNPEYKVDTSTAKPTFVSTIGGSDNTVSSISGDNIISGKAEAHAIITVSTPATTASAGTILGFASASAAGDWSYEFLDQDYLALGQGAGKTISVEAEDRAGNKASATSVSFTIDTQAPSAPTIQSVGTDNIVSSNANDNVVRGTAIGASRISLYLGNSPTILGTVTINAQGEWTYALTSTNLSSFGEEGVKTIIAKASDTAGNLSDASSEFNFVLDQTAPTVISAELFSNDSQNSFLNTGDTVTARLTMSEPVVVTGKPILRLQIGSQSVDAVFTSVSESELFFDYKIVAGQSDGDGISIKANSLVLPTGAAIKDAAGNNATLTHAELTNQANLMVDTTITIPTINSIGGVDRTVTAAASDKIVVGKADPASIIVLKAGESELGRVTASATGDWSYELSEADISSIGQGSGKSITATANDLAGNQSAASSAFSFGVFTLIPAAPTIQSVGGADSIISTLSNDKRIQGSAPGASKVTLFVAATSTSLGTVTVNVEGQWSYDLTPANLTTFGQGPKTITAKASDAIGQLSLASDEFSFTVDTTAPSVKSIALIDAEGAQAGLLNAGDVVTAKVTMSEPVLVSGAPTLKLVIGTANVEASFNHEQSSDDVLLFTYTIGDAQADSNGIAIPANALTIVSGSAITDLAGNPAVVTSSAVADNSAFKVDTIATTPVITEAGGTDKTVTTAANDQLVRGTAEAGAVVRFQSGDNTFGLTTAGSNGAWSYALSESDLEIITQGFNRTITATSVDPAGNASAPSSAFSFRVATQPPPAPVIETAGNALKIISAANSIVSGSSEISSRIVLFVGDTTTALGTVTANSQGRWSYTLTPANIMSLGQGLDRQLTATAADSFNNVSARSEAFLATVDTLAPTVTSVILESESGAQNGILNAGDIVTAMVTMSEPVSVSESVSPTLKLLVGTATVNANFNSQESTGEFMVFNYTILPNQTDADGISIPANALTLGTGAAITDLAGNKAVVTSGAVTNNAAYKVDTTIAKPVITEVGGSDKLVTTKANDSQVKGTAEAGATVSIKFGDAVLGEATADSKGAWLYTLSDDNIETIGQVGQKTITASAEDLAGNKSGSSAAFSFTVATEPPPAPVISQAGSDDQNVISSASGDNLIAGTAQAGTKVTLFRASSNPAVPAAIATVTASSEGKWSYALTTPNINSIGQGDGKTIWAKAVDVAGNQSDDSENFSFTVDTTAPKVNAIVIESAEGGQNGFLNKDDVVTAKVTMSEAVTVTGAPTLKLQIGTSSVNATYDAAASSDEYLVFNYKILANQSDPKGISIPANALTIGTGVSIVDLAGNKAVVTSSAVTNNAAYKVDTTIAKPVITEVGGSDKLVTTKVNDSQVKGTAEAGATVSIKFGDAVLGEATADSKGAWLYTLSDDNIETIGQGGQKTITASAEDLAGNTSDPSAAFSFTVATQPPPAPVISQAGSDAQNVISSASGDNLIAGTAQLGTKVTLFTANASAAIATVTVSSQGKWSYALTTANITSIGQGIDKTITAKATDAAGNVSDASDSLSFAVDTTAPKVNAIVIESAEGGQNGFLNKDDVVTAKVTMSEAVNVTGAPTLKLQIGTSSVNATYDAAASSDEYLVFNYKILANQSDPKGISIPANALTISAGVSIVDLAGNKAVVTSSAVTNNAAYKVDTTIAKPVITEVGGSDKLVTTKLNDSQVKGTAEAGATISIKFGDAVLGEATADSKGAWLYTLSEDNIETIGQGGQKTITASAEDLAGNRSDPSAAFSFTVATQPPPAPVISQAGSDVQNVISSASGDNLIAGTAQLGTKVTLFTVGSNPAALAAIATVTVSSQGKWSYALTTANITSIGQGMDKTIIAKATDAAGNVSDSSDSLSFTVDTTAPKVNAIVIESAEGGQNGFLNKDDVVTAKVTMSEAVTVTGAPTLKLLIGATSVNATYDAAASSDEYLVFNYKILASQSDSKGISIPANALTIGTAVSIVDLAGNKAVVTSSAVANNAAFKVDTTIAKPVITEVGGTDKIVVSTIASDTVVKGTAEANALVIIQTGTGASLVPLGTVTASGTGSWSYALTPANVASIGYGTGRSIAAIATDPAGNTSEVSAAFAFAAYDTLVPGSAANETINGTAGVDFLNGAAGNDVITGKAGDDVITLGAGKDTLVFGGSGSLGSMVMSAASVLVNLGRDSITDYSVVDDSIQLSQAAFGSLATGDVGALDSSKFTAVASAATVITKDYRDGGFLYNSGTGDLLYTTANLSGQSISGLLLTGDNANAAIIANFVNKPALVSGEFSVTS